MEEKLKDREKEKNGGTDVNKDKRGAMEVAVRMELW